eukprot:XP_016657502.1 PREDICTED: uncharacterized protein LOC107882899 [Acyrthosiphon pisum]
MATHLLVRDRRMGARSQLLSTVGLPHIPKYLSRPLSVGPSLVGWSDRASSAEASAVILPRFGSVYHGLLVGPYQRRSPRRGGRYPRVRLGSLCYASPRHHRSDRHALLEVAVKTSDTLVPEGFGVSASDTLVPEGFGVTASQTPAPAGPPFSRLLRQAGKTADLFLYRPDRRAIFGSSICSLLEALPSKCSEGLICRLICKYDPVIWWPRTLFLLKFSLQIFSLDFCSWATVLSDNSVLLAY